MWAQVTDTIVTIQKKLRSHFWQQFCTSDVVPLLGTPKTARVTSPSCLDVSPQDGMGEVATSDLFPALSVGVMQPLPISRPMRR